MNSYEFTAILRNKETESLVDKVKALLQKYEVTITSEEPWGIRKLAYEIKGAREGYYFFAAIDAKPEAIETLTKELKLVQDVLRIMFVRVEAKQSA